MKKTTYQYTTLKILCTIMILNAILHARTFHEDFNKYYSTISRVTALKNTDENLGKSLYEFIDEMMEPFQEGNPQDKLQNTMTEGRQKIEENIEEIFNNVSSLNEDKIIRFLTEASDKTFRWINKNLNHVAKALK